MNIHDLLTGLMLGDGGLNKRRLSTGENASLRIQRSAIDEDYLVWSAKLLSDFISERAITKGSYVDKRTGREYKHIRLRTLSRPIFTDLYKKWYINTKKTVPKDLVLNFDIVKVWFADDGYVATNVGRYGKCNFEIKFATHGFSKEEVYFLKNRLDELFGVEFVIYEEKNKKQKSQYTIRLYTVSKCKKFLRLIDKDFPLKRKSDIWRNPECRTFEDVVNPNCKYCNSSKVHKNGHLHGVSSFKCMGCGRNFTEKTTGKRKRYEGYLYSDTGKYWERRSKNKEKLQ
jgi:hypothetical protein